MPTNEELHQADLRHAAAIRALELRLGAKDHADEQRDKLLKAHAEMLGKLQEQQGNNATRQQVDSLQQAFQKTFHELVPTMLRTVPWWAVLLFGAAVIVLGGVAGLSLWLHIHG